GDRGRGPGAGAVHAAPRLRRGARGVQGAPRAALRRGAAAGAGERAGRRRRRVTAPTPPTTAPGRALHLDLSCDDLPVFFEARHQELAARLRAAAPAIAAVETSAGQGEAARDAAAVAALAEAGLFALVAPEGGRYDVRALCLARELLGWVSPRA